MRIGSVILLLVLAAIVSTICYRAGKRFSGIQRNDTRNDRSVPLTSEELAKIKGAAAQTVGNG